MVRPRFGSPEDLELGEPVAVKLFRPDLSPASRERLRREVRIGRSLGHPGLVRVFELIEVGDRLAIVMEWVPGGSLVERLEAGPLPIPEVVDVARQALETLADLHERQVVHRDVKPSNLLLAGDGHVKLADLGLARNLSEASDVTRTATAVGTPAYMSPEQLLGREPQPATDLYALGATLYELLTGRRPFDPAAEGPDPRLTARAPSPRRLRPNCPHWLSSFVRRLLEREPRDRFPDASRALAAFDRRRLLVSPRTRRRLLAASLVAAVACGGVGLVWQLLRPAPPTLSVSGSTVVALDSRGTEMWRRDYAGFEADALAVDLVGDRSPEVVVQLRVEPDGVPEGTPDVRVLSTHGQEVGAISSTLGMLRQVYPDLWVSGHARWYPTVVGLWRLRTRDAPEVLLVNSGHIYKLATADLDGDGRQEIVAAGVNNPLGFQSFVAVLSSGERDDGWATDATLSPDLASSWPVSHRYRHGTYTVLGAMEQAPALLRCDAAGILVDLGGRTLLLGRFGEPLSADLPGATASARRELWHDMYTACLRFEGGEPGWERVVADLEAKHGQLLAEPPLRVAVSLMLARSLARAGKHQASVSVLERALERVPTDRDLALRLGEQRAILGLVEEADSVLERASHISSSGRPPLDAVVARALLAGLYGRAQEFGATRRLWHTWSGSRKVAPEVTELDAIWAFTQAEWSHASLAEAQRVEVIPSAAPLRAWARFERGGAPGAVRPEAERLEQHPETRALARLLLARLDAASGSSERAVIAASEVLADLERRGRESFEIFAWVPLAERLLGDAQTAAGRPAEAAPHLARARRLAPGRLVREGRAGLPRPALSRKPQLMPAPRADLAALVV